MKTRSIVMLLAVLLTVGLPPVSAAEEVEDALSHLDALVGEHGTAGPQTPFSDLDEAAWAAEDIAFLVDRGILAGVEEGRFAPNDSVTRAQYTKMLVLALGLYDETAAPAFSDVAETHWAASYIGSAFSPMELGGEAFSPDVPISREDMAYFSVLLMQKAGISVPLDATVSFADEADIAAYAKGAVAAMADLGIIHGVGDNRFDPKGNCTRAAAAKVLRGVMDACA